MAKVSSKVKVKVFFKNHHPKPQLIYNFIQYTTVEASFDLKSCILWFAKQFAAYFIHLKR